jgi:hypothetical protein
MKPQSHRQRLKESLFKIEESIQGDLVLSQMTIGFHTSAAAANLLELYLHQQNFVDNTFRFQHNWMKSKNAMKEKLPFQFPRKEEVVSLLYTIEKNRDMLCYGAPQPEKQVVTQIEVFNHLKKIFEELGIDEL